MKWFISQPMNGRSDDDIRKERLDIELWIRRHDCNAEILDSFFEDEPKTGNVGMKYLARSIDLLAEADRAYFAKGWSEARGCKFEHEIALAYGVGTIIEISDDDGKLYRMFDF